MTSAEDAPRTIPAPEAAGVAAAGAGELARLRAENAVLQETIAVLLARVAELERRLGLNSSNSGKPPSSDGLHKPKREPRTRSLRQPSGKPPGGQKGHKGETLRQVAEPDHTIDHLPEACPACGSALTAAMSTGYGARQVFDLPEPQPLAVTEHHLPLRALRRAGAGRVSRRGRSSGTIWPAARGNRGLPAPLPASAGGSAGRGDGRPVRRQAGDRHHRPDEPELCRARPGGRRCRLRVREGGGGQAPGRFRIGGRTQWLHIASTVWLVFYRVSTRRGSLMEGVTGIVVHDHWKPYYTMEGVVHALCNAHHLRELQALVEIEKEDWARRMQRLLRRACHAATLARERDRPLKPALVDLFRRHYDAVVAEGSAFHDALPPLAPATTKGGKPRRGRPPRRTGHNLLRRLETRKEDVLRFLVDPAVPFTNNEAERDGRMMKLRQKISGGFRSEEGARDFAIIRSLIATAKKQRWNIIHTLAQTSDTLLAQLRTV